MTSPDRTTPHVVIIGGGFAGLWATRALKGAPVRVALVDRCNHHLFQPLLYQVATAGLSAPAFHMHRLAVLTGRTPDALVAELEPQHALPTLPARLDAGTPGELLRRRPDVAAAKARLHSATRVLPACWKC